MATEMLRDCPLSTWARCNHMSPEQLQGTRPTRAPIYSFGCVLYGMLKGRTPTLARSADRRPTSVGGRALRRARDGSLHAGIAGRSTSLLVGYKIRNMTCKPYGA